MKTKANLYVILTVLIFSILGCKKEEVLTPEKLLIGKWKIMNIVEYRNISDPPLFNLIRVNSAQKYIFEITDSKYSVIDITLNNKVIDETAYVFKDGLFYGALKNGYIFLGFNVTTGRKITFEGNDKMTMRIPINGSSVFEDITYSRIQ